MTYTAPVAELMFTLRAVAGLDEVTALPGMGEVTPDLAEAILTEAGKLAGEVIAPLNRTGDLQGATLENGVVRSADGFADAFRAFAEGGWNGLPFDPDYGGQGLPWVLATAVQEMWQGACLSFALNPLLNQGVMSALTTHGTAEQKQTYIPRIASGQWTGTMNLTEPQAGTDLGAVRTMATPAPDLGPGRYRLIGQKIYITWGDHDLAENIVHLVLARTPDAPPGSRGLSLFIVPKFAVNADGSLGPRNDVRTVSLEHKLGIHASPTCVLAYGDDGGAVGEIVGKEHEGLKGMFTMMNNARVSVGVQGVGIAERAYQQALAYARERVQGRTAGDGKVGAPILHHPDVRRMLMWMKAHVAATRALCMVTAAAEDTASRHADEAQRATAQDRVDLLTPIVKSWCTDVACEVASTAVQVHGGMGFIEETGAAQHYRDARILPIYEGTNGVQAADLVGRKIGRDEGAAMRALCAEISATATALGGHRGLQPVANALSAGVLALETATDYVADTIGTGAVDALSGSAPYLRLAGMVIGGWLLAKGALAVHEERVTPPEGNTGAVDTPTALAAFYAAHVLPQADGLRAAAMAGSDPVMALTDAQM